MTRVMEDPEVLIAYEMNGQALPMLNGFPARLIVPGSYATYWVKHLSDITVIDHVFEEFWMKPAYRIPDTPCRMSRARDGSRANRAHQPHDGPLLHRAAGAGGPGAGRAPVSLKGIAFDSGYGIQEVHVSDDGVTWRRADLGADLGRYSFREWAAQWTPSRPGPQRLIIRAFNRIGESQGHEPLWNPAGYLRNVIEQVEVIAA